MPFTIDGRTCHFRGTVTVVSADNPASASLGGFKQSASAFRFCRHCLGTENDIQTKVHICMLHKYYCALLHYTYVCRHTCVITLTYMYPVLYLPCTQFIESQFELRSGAKHLDHCSILEQDDLSTAEQQHYSIVYGVNRRALLNTLDYFSVASGALIPDVMHDILEGALPLEVKLMLKVCNHHINLQMCDVY